jgi:hypothetical protein
MRGRRPLPAIVNSPSTKSVGASGNGTGFQRSWSGVTGPSPKVVVEAGLRECGERTVHRGRTDAVEPAAPVGVPRRGERGARQLLGVQAVRDALRRVAAHGQRTGCASVANSLPKPDW